MVMLVGGVVVLVLVARVVVTMGRDSVGVLIVRISALAVLCLLAS